MGARVMVYFSAMKVGSSQETHQTINNEKI